MNKLRLIIYGKYGDWHDTVLEFETEEQAAEVGDNYMMQTMVDGIMRDFEIIREEQ